MEPANSVAIFMPQKVTKLRSACKLISSNTAQWRYSDEYRETVFCLRMRVYCLFFKSRLANINIFERVYCLTFVFVQLNNDVYRSDCSNSYQITSGLGFLNQSTYRRSCVNCMQKLLFRAIGI